MEVQKKIQQARKLLKETDMQKSGHNDYSDYDYFTPDQVSMLVYDVEQKLNLFHKFDLISSDGIYGVITIYDLESSEELEFKMLTDIPAITATNKTQQLGGAVTYSNRYLLMSIYDIQDNNLDLDTPKKKVTNSNKDKPKAEDGGKKTLTSAEVEQKWNGKIYSSKLVYIDNVKYEIPAEQIEKLKTHKKYKKD